MSSNKTLDEIEGTKVINPNTGKLMTIYLKSKEQLEVELEIATNHPKLQQLLQEDLKEDNYAYETFFGICFAYCGVILDSTNSQYGYRIDELYEQLGRGLLNKRECMAVSINTIPSKEAIVNILVEMRDTHDEQTSKITTDTRMH